jgi:hypothetical protein
MSMEAVVQVIERASADAAFRARLASREEAVLADYDLDPAERAALLNATSEKLQALGVDVRSSKWGIGGRGDEQDSVIEWFNAQFP